MDGEVSWELEPLLLLKDKSLLVSFDISSLSTAADITIHIGQISENSYRQRNTCAVS